jgi:Secretion system C-terminal sorting domain
MKRLFLAVVFLLAGSCSFAVNSINENFNTVVCPSPTRTYPSSWVAFLSNSSLGNVDSLSWLCTNNNGRNSTGGVFCTGYFANTYHFDTAYLISPELNLIGTTDSIFLNFDTKTNFFYSGSRLDVLVTPDSFTVNPGSPFLSALPSPIIGPGDSTNWVTHQISLYPYRFYQHLHIAFRYISNDSYGSIWYLDNIQTTSVKLLGVKNITDEDNGGLIVKGDAGANHIKLSYSAAATGMQQVQIMDMIGRVVYETRISMERGDNDFTLRNMNLNNGMYIIKISNGLQQAFTKVMVQ